MSATVAELCEAGVASQPRTVLLPNPAHTFPHGGIKR